MGEKKLYKLSRKEKAKGRLEYAAQSIVEQARVNSWKQIGFTTSSKYERPLQTIAGYVKELGEKDGLKTCIVDTLTQYPGNVFEAEKCDTVVFVERYAYSYYSELETCLKLMKKHDVSVLGVITYR
ncbi:CpsD/CapB family tyrosine-protein kinase [[Clostridium] hylemonae]|uniref:CpsD/CapB family tyrosine-protein kinase n=1 Tax=[Clostridium] hylemonae TaxID=89153 RepID=UPI001106D5A9|nr:CpsD/CapB family tyrosine-protein kinase [[Clostridium] hylemonae]